MGFQLLHLPANIYENLILHAVEYAVICILEYCLHLSTYFDILFFFVNLTEIEILANYSLSFVSPYIFIHMQLCGSTGNYIPSPKMNIII